MIKNKLTKKGFTLVEMIVVMGIVTIIIAVTLFNYQDVNSKSILKNVAYDMALSFREIQSLGLGAKKYTLSNTTTDSFKTPFGAQFNSGQDIYMLFADEDQNNNCFDNSTLCVCPDGECLSLIRPGYDKIKIYDVCVSDDNGDNSDCISNELIDYASAIFKRPNPDARIYSSESSSPKQLMRVLLQVKDSDDLQMIKVTNTGQVSVKSCTLSSGDYKVGNDNSDCI